MNHYKKYCPNVYVAGCDSEHKKGDTIIVTTSKGKEHECIVFNFLKEIKCVYYYSIIRANGFDYQEWAKSRADRREKWADSAEKKSDEYYERSNKDREFLSLGEPVKVGHHSEGRHRRILDQARNNIAKSFENDKKATEHKRVTKYWKHKSKEINLSMPKSIEFYQKCLENAKEDQKGLKDGTIPREHSFSLTYATKTVKDLEKKLETAKILWG